MITFLRRIWTLIFGKFSEGGEECASCPPGEVTGEIKDECSDCPPEYPAGLLEYINGLKEGYLDIYTNNTALDFTPRPVREGCITPSEVNNLINTKNACNKVGQISHTKTGTFICLECGDCGGGLSTRSSSDGSSSGSVVSLDSLPKGDCMIDNSCPDTNCGFWHYVNFVRRTSPVPTMKITGRDGRNRELPEDDDSLQERGDCNPDSISVGTFCVGSEGQICGTCFCDDSLQGFPEWVQDDPNAADPFSCSQSGDPDGPGNSNPCPDVPCSDDECQQRSDCGCYDSSSLDWCTKKPTDNDGPIDPDTGSGSSTCKAELIYDETGCKVIGVKPVVLARGELGYWENQIDTYPLTKNCFGDYIHGDDAGKPIRHHRMPNLSTEPHFLSFQTGVVSHLDPGNDDEANTYVRFIRIEISGLTVPEGLDKPINAANPFTIKMTPRTGANKSVIGTALAINTFKTNIHGEDFAVAKNGINSLEYFDRSTHYGGDDTHRGGENMDKNAMVLYSPDFEFDQPSLNIDTISYDLNLFGKGMRHHLYADGINPDNKNVGKENAKGSVSAVNLSKFVVAAGSKGMGKPITRCVQAISYAPANRIIAKEDKFSYPLLNINRESSVYVELKGAPVQLKKTRNNQFKMPNNGHPGRPKGWDGTSDLSWLGDCLFHTCPVHDASAWMVTLKSNNPNQYGGVVNQNYIPIHHVTPQELQAGRFTVNHGDSYIGQHNVVRKSFATEKIMKDISPLLMNGGYTDGGILQTLLRNMFGVLGLNECATTPENGDTSDPRNGNLAGEHNELRRSTNKCWDGLSQPPSATGKDIYFPNLQKMLATFIVPSDVKLKYRATGNEELGEVHVKNLRGWNLDSTMPYNSDWKKSFLDRFHVLSKENPKWRMIMRVICNLLFTFGVGLYCVIYGLGMTVNSLAQMSAGTTVNFGGIVGAILEIGTVGLGVAWIIFWANSDLDNKFWDNVLGIDGCWPDVTYIDPNMPGGKAHGIKDGRVHGFTDEYYDYNYDFSKDNDYITSLGLPDPYNTCDCGDEKSYEIIYSNKQNPESTIDAYRNFKVNNYLEMPSHTGKLQKLFLIANRMFVQTTGTMWSLRTGSRELQVGSDSVFLGAGNFLNTPVDIFAGPIEGRGGTMDPNAGIMTAWGYVYPDSESRGFNLFNGNEIIELGLYGMSKFMNNHMRLDGQKGIRDEKVKDGWGYNIGVDNTNGFIHFTVNKGEEDPDDFRKKKSWTLTYDANRKRWVGFEVFTPQVYTWDKYNMFSFIGEKMMIFNVPHSYNTFNGKYYPSVVDFVISNERRDTIKFNSLEVDVEFFEYDGGGYKALTDEFFTGIGAYNSYQSSGLLPTRLKENSSILDWAKQDYSVVKINYLHRLWQLNGIIDKVFAKSKGSRTFTTYEEGIYTDFVQEILEEDKRVDPTVVDNHLVVRMVYDGRDNVKFILKRTISQDKTENR